VLGAGTREVAQRLYLSPETVRSHVRNAMSKTSARTRAQLVATRFPKDCSRTSSCDSFAANERHQHDAKIRTLTARWLPALRASLPRRVATPALHARITGEAALREASALELGSPQERHSRRECRSGPVAEAQVGPGRQREQLGAKPARTDGRAILQET
jgi:hypothetical protein